MTTPACTHAPEITTRKERLLVAVWDAWRDGHPLTYRELARKAGYSSTGHLWNVVESLHDAGLLSKEENRDRTLRPGPRFGGVHQGKPWRIICDEDQFRESNRQPKYERRSVLFEVA